MKVLQVFFLKRLDKFLKECIITLILWMRGNYWLVIKKSCKGSYKTYNIIYFQLAILSFNSSNVIEDLELFFELSDCVIISQLAGCDMISGGIL